MALTRTEINQLSNDRRGIKNKAFKLHVDDIELIKKSASAFNTSEAKFIVDAVKFYIENNKAH